MYVSLNLWKALLTNYFPSFHRPTSYGSFFERLLLLTVPSDLCLLGCVFYIADYQKYMEASLLNTWKEVRFEPMATLIKL